MVSLVLPVALPALPALPVVGGGNAAEGGILAPGAESGDRVPERGPFEKEEGENGGGKVREGRTLESNRRSYI